VSTGSFDRLVVAAHEGKSAAQLRSLPVDAISGVSSGDAAHLKDAFGIETIDDLARNRFFKAARSIRLEAADVGHDPGPDVEWTEFFATAPLAVYQAHPTSFRLDFGPAYYRGRLDGTARVLVIGQDPAANELIGHRVFVGTSGQRVQGFLSRLGITRDYVMVNTFLYPVFGQFFFADLTALTQDPDILGFRNALLSRIVDLNEIEAVVAVGGAAKDAVERWPGSAGRVVEHITHPSADDHAALLADWNEGLTALRAAVSPEIGVTVDPSFTYGSDWVAADQIPIPRRDLPFGVPPFHGAGDHATRARKDDGTTDHKRIIWKAP
jgi:hypothetical protein